MGLKTIVITTILILISFWSKAQSEGDSLQNRFSIRGGVYMDSSLFVEIDTAGFKVYFTVDGSKPNYYSTRYSKGIKLTKTTPIRAAFYQNGSRIGISTQTYLLGRSYNMAVISITVNNEDFFGFDRGIYVKGCCAQPTQPYKGANFWKGWEREINIEFYESNNELGFNQPAGARIFGGFSKGLPMKSLAILARNEYGNNRFEYPIFPNKDIKKFKSFVLRSSGGDFNKTHMRDALLTHLVEPLDIEIQAYRPAVVYINGAYWGIHNVREKINEHYLKYNCGADQDSVDIMKHRNDLLSGTRTSYHALLKFINKTNFSDTSQIIELNKLMDIDNYIIYNQAEIYSDNGDAGGNIRYWREQKEGARWRWILFDLDLGMSIGDWKAYKVNTLKQMTTPSNETWPNPSWSTVIIRKLLKNDSIKELYINRFADRLNTIFSSENVNFRIDSIKNLIAPEMPYHIQKWPTTIEKWERNITVIKAFATYRPQYLRQYLMEKFELVDTVHISIDSVDNTMGYVRLNSLTVVDSSKGWYFNGCPVQIEAIPKKGYEFIRWKETNDSTQLIIMNPTDEITLTPIFKKKGISSYHKKVVMNEVSLKQKEDDTTGDWLELYNLSSEPIDIIGWEITTKDAESFRFKESTIIGKNGYLIIAKNYQNFSSFFKDSTLHVSSESLGFGFSSKKDFISLLDDTENIIDTLEYNIKKNFKKSKGTFSLEKLNPKFESKVVQWSIGKEVSPGKQNQQLVEESIEEDVENNQLWIYVTVLLMVLFGLLIYIFLRKKNTNEQ
ncbi:MAG: hypothetical protein ACI9N1_001447 [Flavobacteriales bacterium]|jgi:hypothetical protein